MDIIKLTISSDAYSGVDGCISILRQNCISAEQTEFPFRFSINITWSKEDIDTAISQIDDYNISFDETEVFTIRKK